MNKLIFVRLNIIRNIIFKSATSNSVVPIINNNKFEIKRYLNYKTPVNRTKTFSPTTIAVTNANKHLIIDLFDENNVNLGQMRLDKAKELADGKNLKLVITEETSAPPKFALMNGHSLYQLQMKYREANKDNVKEQKFKEIEVNLGIDDHDLDIKIKMLKNFFEKGDLIKFKVLSKIINKKVMLYLNN
jgi:translation initiation factor IF-3